MLKLNFCRNIFFVSLFCGLKYAKKRQSLSNKAWHNFYKVYKKFDSSNVEAIWRLRNILEIFFKCVRHQFKLELSEGLHVKFNVCYFYIN